MILLNIQASPRGSKSISIAATDAFVEAYRAAHPDVRVDNLNVWEEGLPEFDSEAIGAKYKGVSKEAMSDAESAIWKSIQSLAARFQAASVPFSSPLVRVNLDPCSRPAMPSSSTVEGRPMRNIHRRRPRCLTTRKVTSTFGFTSSA